jgi:glycosyltransferase involved in cell wall biosynthesis
LRELYRRLVAVAETITSDFELVLVEDHGPDGSWRVLEELAAADPRVKAIRLSRNYGQHYAITAGLDHANGDWVVVMDCDLQDPPEEIPTLYRKAQEGYDIVFARRINRKDSWTKTLPGDMFWWLVAKLTGFRWDRATANFSISSRQAVAAFREYRERDRSFPMIMHRVGFARTSVDVEHAPRFAGETSYSWRKLVSFAIQNVVAASTRPLVLSVQFGAAIALLSIGYSLYLAIRYFLQDVHVAGWTSLAVLITFLFGLLFIQLGVVGLYLGRTFEESKRRPLYHIMNARNTGPAPAP